MDFESYFREIENRVRKECKIVNEARKKGFDPEMEVEAPLSMELAEKAVNLVSSSLFPELDVNKVVGRIKELEKKYGKGEDLVAFIIAKEIAENKVQNFETLEKAMEVGIRIGLSYLTGGVVTAPLDGICRIKIRKNDDGSDYLALYYAGPIRSAGGTAMALSVLLADYVRISCGLSRYNPREEEIERYVIEVEDYSTKVAKKQYVLKREETAFIVRNLCVEVTGIPTEDIEVSNFKDLDRVETNKIRGGLCLVLLDGIPLKASKIKKKLEQYGYELGLENWKWIESYLEMQKRLHLHEKSSASNRNYVPVRTYLDEIVAGRPVFSHPGAFGGFRLRYGRSRATGLLGFGLNPATMLLCENFLAIGTQIRTEYPGKAGVVTACDSIAGPVVRLKNGDVLEVRSIEEGESIKKDVEKILFLGDILVSYGDVSNQGKFLLPSGYVEEWWVQELEEAIEKSGEGEEFKKFLDMKNVPNANDALKISKKFGVPLHPKYTYLWHYLTKEEFLELYNAWKESKEVDDGFLIEKYEVKEILEKLLLPHKVRNGILISKEDGIVLKELLGHGKNFENELKENFIEVMEEFSGIKIKNKCPVFLGAKMGRPEKAMHRVMKGKPQILFPCGKFEGGRLRNLMDSYKKGSVFEKCVLNYCKNCNKITPFFYCVKCGERAAELRKCVKCKKKVFENKHCGVETVRFEEMKIDLKELMDKALENIGETSVEILKAPRAVMSGERLVEPLEKGILRAKYGLFVNKDGTIRYDSTNLPMTHFTPREINVPLEKLRALGYTKDIYGNELVKDDQILLLMPQDIIISDNEDCSCADYFYKVSKFIDELLVKFYKLEPFYSLKNKEELIGHLVVGLAPHTSAGIVGRIIGFTKAKGCFAHPYWHAAKRRNCDGDEDSIMLLTDCLLNFSRRFLPDHIGGRSMDAPLVLSAVLRVDEVDDESLGVDCARYYPLEFYKATQNYEYPWKLKVQTFKDKVKEGCPFISEFTHDTSEVSKGPKKSAYVSLKEMPDKVNSQLGLAEKILAVDENDVAELLLETHFLTDVKGNLRTFSKQEFRCSTCNEKYRRLPLSGICGSCGKKLVFTVSEGTIRKYLDPSYEIATKYKVSGYTLQQIINLKRYVQSLFGKEIKQNSLGKFLNRS